MLYDNCWAIRLIAALLLTFMSHIRPVASPQGGFGGLSPSKQCTKPPNWNVKTINWWSFVNFYNVKQGRIFIFGALGSFKLGFLLKVCDDWCHKNQHHTCSLHSLDKLLQFINIFLCSEFPRYQERKQCQPLSISSNWGATLSQRTQNSEPKPPKQNFNPPNCNVKH